MLKWSPDGGAEGTLHAVYEDKPAQQPGRSDRDIYHVRSTDGGRTWTQPKKLNDDQDPQSIEFQVTPNLDIAPDARVTAAWWDFRDDDGAFPNDVYATWSDDNGETWAPNQKITDRPINRRLGVWSNGSDMRGPPAIASTGEYTVFGWDDTRLGTDEAPVQDIFTRAVQSRPWGTAATRPATWPRPWPAWPSPASCCWPWPWPPVAASHSRRPSSSGSRQPSAEPLWSWTTATVLQLTQTGRACPSSRPWPSSPSAWPPAR